MSTLLLHQDDDIISLPFSAPALLTDVLAAHGIIVGKPCGGRGVCGKCRVSAVSGAISRPNAREAAASARLACQMTLLGDAEITLPSPKQLRQTDLSGDAVPLVQPMPGAFGATVDIGTTTLGTRLYSLSDGTLLANADAENPQTSISADVLGRISHALKHGAHVQQEMLLHALDIMLNKMCDDAAVPRAEVASLVVTGNTTMLYLLCGLDPACLSAAPFAIDHAFGETMCLLECNAYLPPCIGAFTGADLVCGLLTLGSMGQAETVLLCDIGTNGETALWHHGKLYVTSVAAGPAFEGVGISCGCGSIDGAIDRVWVEGTRLGIHTIGGKPALGLCGSGLIDSIAAGLQRGLIDKTGRMEKVLTLAEHVTLEQQDVRAVQLAKGAVLAGIDMLLEAAHIDIFAVDKLYIAGGFGSHIHIGHAMEIGLLPRMEKTKIQVLGNAALTGASMLLMNTRMQTRAAEIAEQAKVVSLGGNDAFMEKFLARMNF